MGTVHGGMGCGQKKLLVSVVVPPAPVRVPSQRPLAPSVTSVTSVANLKGDHLISLARRGPFIHGAMSCSQKSLS